MVGHRLHVKYTEAQLTRMFEKADVNGDRLVDLNEFILMQATRNASWLNSELNKWTATTTIHESVITSASRALI